MDNFIFGGRPETVIQLGYVVEDIERSVTEFGKRLGIGPWYRFRASPPRPSAFYRGRPAHHDISFALAFHGTMMLELMQQHDDSPSVLREGIARRGYGFHHWGIGTRRFDERVAEETAQGKEVIYTARTGRGVRIAFFEGPGPMQGMKELIEVTSANEEFYAAIAQQANQWDGKTLEWSP